MTVVVVVLGVVVLVVVWHQVAAAVGVLQLH